jgi:asparagine synthase (glutamine-hydrolysing)
VAIGHIGHLFQLWRHFGSHWLLYRASYAARLRLGLMRKKLPAAGWDEQPLESFLNNPRLQEPSQYLDYRRAQAPDFFFNSSSRHSYQNYFAAWDKAATVTPVHLSEQLAQGEVRYFGYKTAQAGFPPDWHANPFTGKRAPADIHWSEIDDFDYGDIKIIWEPSRFEFAYALVRAYWRTSDERYGERFWQAFEDWREKNPPQLGANWKCGQETTFRVMAWCFALYGFLDAQATTAPRLANLAQAIAVSGGRIEANLDYALSQRNNHGISEGLGLWTIGALFPEFRSASHWKNTGREVLESQARELIYTDGAFSQHSVNYHRLMLHDYLWALRLGDILGEPFSDELKTRIRVAGNFLYQIQDLASGRLPNYGHNDGALILPLNNCDYQDFRPVIQATHYLTDGARVYEAGAWDEDLLWLFGAASLSAPAGHKAQADFKAEQGGYYTLRSTDGYMFTRCASFQHRPSQADLLHVDLWWRGQNIATDAGTFSYNAPAPWDNQLAHTAYHNTVTVDGYDQMERVGKFLWLPWARGEVSHWLHSQAGHLSYFEGAHQGYERLNSPVHYRRAIVGLGEHWLVLDDLQSLAAHQYRLHWLLMDAPFDWDETSGTIKLDTPSGSYYLQTLVLNGNGGYSIMRADETTARGWRAPYYQTREPALSLALTAQASAACFVSFFGPTPCLLKANQSSLQVQGESWQASVNLQTGNTKPSPKSPKQIALVTSLAIDGAVEDRLEIC